MNTMTKPEHREGLVEVYDWNGNYLGCMGIERWNAVLADDARAKPRGASQFHPASPPEKP